MQEDASWRGFSELMHKTYSSEILFVRVRDALCDVSLKTQLKRDVDKDPLKKN